MKNWIFIFLIAISLPVHGQETTLRFRQLSPDGGFTYSAILSIEQDNQGYIWFGTKNGLYKHDSQKIKKYSYELGKTNSLIDNRINLLLKDNSDKLWIATEGGLCYYDQISNQFIAYPLYNSVKQKVDENILSLTIDQEGNLWILNSFGVGVVKPNNNLIEHIDLGGIISPKGLYIDDKQRMWITSNEGSLFWSEKPYIDIKLFSHIRDAAINDIAVKNDKIWLGYEWEGVDCLGIDGRLIKHYDKTNKGELYLPNNRVRSICIDQTDRIWIGTYGGVLLIEPDGSNTIIQKDKYSEFPRNSIYKIFEDKKNGIWIGSWSGGLCYFNYYDNVFLHYKNDLSGRSLSDNVVSSFAEDKNGDIWVATENGGLNKFHRQTNSFSHNIFELDGNNVYNFKSVLIDQEETVWAGTFKYGLWFKKKGSTKFQLFDHPDIKGQHVYSLFKDNNYMWIGTYGNGLFNLNIETKELEHFSNDPLDPNTLSNNEIRHVFVDSRKNLWVCTQSGLNFLKSGSDRFLQFYKEKNNQYSLNSAQIFYCFEDSKNNIWIGTGGGGLSKVSTDDFKFSSYTTNDGLAGNDVFGIKEDLNGDLWISTDQGLSCFNPGEEEFRNFNAIDGIQGNQFNPGAAYRTSTGELLFGGPNGFTLFNPGIIKLNPIIPNVSISGFKIKNVDSNISDYLINNENDKTDKLILNYQQNAFSFSFVADNYLLPMKNKFKYRLINFNEDWVVANIPIAVYTNIPSGSYTFEILASNNDGIWNNEPYRLNIKIKSPLFLSNLALFIYFVILAGIAILSRKIILERQHLKQDVAFEKMQRNNEAELHKMKLQFFTNISHEFRTPLSLILMPLERIIKKRSFKEKEKHDLYIMRNNANRMLRLINQLMDLRKIDNKKARLKPQRLNVVSFCKDIFECFSTYAEHKIIDYQIEADNEVIYADFDPEMLDKIVYNLLSNAFKFSNDKESIKLTIKENVSLHNEQKPEAIYKTGNLNSTNNIEISVQDTGIGIAKDQLPLIFDRFYQTAEKQNHGTGIGLALSKEYVQLHNGELLVSSELSKGSWFAVRIPVNQQTLVPEIDQNSGKAKFEHFVNSDFIQNNEIEIETTKTITKQKNIHDKELILIVEDNAELAQFIESILTDDYKVISAIDGKHGLQSAIKYLPDLIISDIMMPEMDGLEFSNALKKDIRISHIPFIFLTALNSEENQIVGLKTGISDYITKPFNESILRLKILNILKSRKDLSEKYVGNNTEWSSKMIGLSYEKIFIKKAEQIVSDNLDNSEFSVEDLAKAIGVSRSQLHRKLKNLTNQNPTDFIRIARLTKAAELLKNGHKEIDKIGYAVGFNSHSYFTKCFKNQYGVTPTEYIMQFNNGDN